MKVGVIGLGTMGAPMAANLLAKGFEVVVHNRTREREVDLAAQGAERAETPRDVAAACEALLICVSDTPDLEEVLFAEETGAVHGMRSGQLVIDSSTISPEATRRIHASLAERGVDFIDAPVSGGSEGAIKATLAVMCGGDIEAFGRAEPILRAVGKTITHVGPSGAGQVAKAVNQVVISGAYQAVAEGMVLAHKMGVDPQQVVQAISKGAAASWVLDQRSGNMIGNHYPLGFRVSLHRKDLRIALEAAESCGAELPMARFVAEAEDQLMAEGFADEDMSAIARQVRRASGVGDEVLDGEGRQQA